MTLCRCDGNYNITNQYYHQQQYNDDITIKRLMLLLHFSILIWKQIKINALPKQILTFIILFSFEKLTINIITYNQSTTYQLTNLEKTKKDQFDIKPKHWLLHWYSSSSSSSSCSRNKKQKNQKQIRRY